MSLLCVKVLLTDDMAASNCTLRLKCGRWEANSFISGIALVVPGKVEKLSHASFNGAYLDDGMM